MVLGFFGWVFFCLLFFSPPVEAIAFSGSLLRGHVSKLVSGIQTGKASPHTESSQQNLYPTAIDPIVHIPFRFADFQPIYGGKADFPVEDWQNPCSGELYFMGVWIRWCVQTYQWTPRRKLL